jgi:hypothetical protein
MAIKLTRIYTEQGDNLMQYIFNNLQREGAVVALMVVLCFQLIVENIDGANKGKGSNAFLTGRIVKDERRSPANSGGSNNPSKRRKKAIL